jgi:hypothetical protein
VQLICFESFCVVLYADRSLAQKHPRLSGLEEALMKVLSRAAVLALATLFGFAATTLDGGALAANSVPSQPIGDTQTIGSWFVSGVAGVATAVLTDSAASGNAGGVMPTFRLQLKYGDNSFQDSVIIVTHYSRVLPSNVVFHVLADGKDVGQFNEDSPAGGDLTAMFGANLAGLAPVQNFSVVINNSQTSNSTVFVANLQQTAAALAAMKTVADATKAALRVSETDGAWQVSADEGRADALPTAAATVTSSVKLGPALKPCVVSLIVDYYIPDEGYDSNSDLDAVLFLPVEHQKDATLLLFADGKQIDSVNAATLPAGYYGSDAFGGVIYTKSLSDYFGKDLQGLVSVHNFKVAVNMAGVNTTIYEVNLSGTDKMLQSLPILRQVSIQRMGTGTRVKRRTSDGTFTPPPVIGLFKFVSPPASPPATGSK